MGNFCGYGGGSKTVRKDRKLNPFSQNFNPARAPLVSVLKGVAVGRNIHDKYVMGRELGRGEFSITYLCIDKETEEMLAWKYISKRKLRTVIDIEDVRREVAIMNNFPQHPNIVTLKATYKEDHAVHLVMELYEGGELFDRIVARGH